MDGQWFAFIADPDGKIVGHSDPTMIGSNVQELLGPETSETREDGGSIESDSLRVWVAGYDGHVFGSDWSRNNQP